MPKTLIFAATLVLAFATPALAQTIEEQCISQVAAMDEALTNNTKLSDVQKDRLRLERDMTAGSCRQGGENAMVVVQSNYHYKKMFKKRYGVIFK